VKDHTQNLVTCKKASPMEGKKRYELIPRKALVCWFVLLSTPWIAFAQNTVAAPTSESGKESYAHEAIFHSPSLDRDMHYLVLLPHDYGNGNSFAVLYLLHGLYGDYQNWDTRTGIEGYAKTMPFLIVMPDADNSWYTNSASVPRDKFEDYITKDLISEIDAKYRTIREKRGRAIAGLSMGGYGSVKLAIRHPELFTFAGSLSGAFNAPRNLDHLRPEFRAKLVEVFGSAKNDARIQNDIFLLLKTAHDYPYFYLACGAADFFLDTNRVLAAQLSSQKVPYEYHETAGGHTWEYWDSAVTEMLRATARHFESGSMPAPETK
jgi:putative tributyrin esterase